MAELRTDKLTGRSVFVAENRLQRPNEFENAPAGKNAEPAPPAACPFCPGHESETPPAAYERTDTEGCWQVRVVPNKYPAVSFEDAGELPCGEPSQSSGGAVQPAVGIQEVIIESSRHVSLIGDLSVAELRDVLETYARRLAHWRDDGRFEYGLVFKNVGPSAGASLAHLHSQALALPYVPPAAAAEMRCAKELAEKQNGCPYCALLQHEREQRERVVLDRDGFVVICPHASLQPLEFWLLPAEHAPSFETWSNDADRPDGLDRLAGVLHAVVGRLESIMPAAAYNLLLRTAPWNGDPAGHCHWRIEVIPRLATWAGLELATGIHINPLAPEHAAARLRI